MTTPVERRIEDRRVERKKVSRILHSFMWLILIALTLFTLEGYYERFWPIKTIDVETPVKILTPQVKAGGMVEYETTYCRYADGLGRVTQTLYGAVIVSTPTVSSIYEKGCATQKVLMPIPQEVIPGVYHIKWVAEFDVNPRRTVTIVYESEMFEIIK